MKFQIAHKYYYMVLYSITTILIAPDFQVTATSAHGISAAIECTTK